MTVRIETVRIIITILYELCAIPSVLAANALAVILALLSTNTWREAAVELAHCHVYTFLVLYSTFSFPLSAIVIWFVADPPSAAFLCVALLPVVSVLGLVAMYPGWSTCLYPRLANIVIAKPENTASNVAMAEPDTANAFWAKVDGYPGGGGGILGTGSAAGHRLFSGAVTATQELVTLVPQATPGELQRASDAAAAAFVGWRKSTVLARQRVMFNLQALIRKHMVAFADANGDVLRGLQVVEHACGIPSRLMGELLPVSADMDTYTIRQPLGVVAGIAPFNFPAMIPWMFPLAITCGNTVVMKPAERDPGQLDSDFKLAGLSREETLEWLRVFQDKPEL
ncbi:Methylmalonate-semialdehyde dehydrogenase [acylating] mitochondrial [Cladochytrium tenue]|nr:Methylmalonate-semialdehyde dehydrogenase [acylating] mitochondrial [Cladochytrium tenue]